MVFNDEDLCNKSALFDPLLNALLAKTLNGVILQVLRLRISQIFHGKIIVFHRKYVVSTKY